MSGKSLVRVRVNLDAALVEELLALSGEKSLSAAVSMAIREHLRFAKLRKLGQNLGDIEVDEQSLREQKVADIDREYLLGNATRPQPMEAARRERILKIARKMMDIHHETLKKLAE